MREKLRRAVLLISAAVMMFAASLPAFADEIYEPMPGDYRNVVPWLILAGAVVINLIIAAVVLIIVFSIRKKKRRKQEQK